MIAAGRRPLRVSFLGDPLNHARWALTTATTEVAPTFVAHRAGADPATSRAMLMRALPEVVVVLDVDSVAPAAFEGAAPVALGVSTSPPATRSTPTDGPWDRLVAVDPAAAGGRPLWRLLTPPVDDRLFRPLRRAGGPARIVVLAASTGYREGLLTDAKHAHDLRHIAHGITPARLPATLAGADAAICLRAGGEASFEHAVAVHLAAGHLVITDPLVVRHGLEPDIDVLEARDGADLTRIVGALRRDGDTYHRVRVRGRLKAESFRASRVWPRVLADLLADLDAFGRGPTAPRRREARGGRRRALLRRGSAR